jgi:hypothetical protein
MALGLASLLTASGIGVLWWLRHDSQVSPANPEALRILSETSSIKAEAISSEPEAEYLKHLAHVKANSVPRTLEQKAGGMTDTDAHKSKHPQNVVVAPDHDQSVSSAESSLAQPQSTSQVLKELVKSQEKVSTVSAEPLKWNPQTDPTWWDSAFPKVEPSHVHPDVQALTQAHSRAPDRFEKLSAIRPQEISPTDSARIMRYLSQTLPPSLPSTESIPKIQGSLLARDPLQVSVGAASRAESPAEHPDSERVSNTNIASENAAHAQRASTPTTVSESAAHEPSAVEEDAVSVASEELAEAQDDIPSSLSEEQRRRLQDGLGENAIKNDLLEVLLAMEPMPQDLGEMMLSVVADPAQSPVWRDYVIQHYSVYLSNLTQGQDADHHQQASVGSELAKFRQSYLEQAQRDRSSAATSLMGMHLMIQQGLFDNDDVLKQAQDMLDGEGLSPGARASARQVVQDLSPQDGYTQSAAIATDPDQSFAERLVAVHHLGSGGPDQRLLLQNLLQQSDLGSLKRAVESSLKRLKEFDTP